MKIVYKTFLTAITWAALGAAAFAQTCQPDVVNLRHDGAKARFTIELADDPEEQARGLMHRKSMARFAGMLFVYDQPSHATFWMRNTLIPLDMLFVNEAGVVTYIHRNAEPLSEAVIDGGRQVKAVLEINGGMADKLRIGIGAELQHPAFGEMDAAWPCMQ